MKFSLFYPILKKNWLYEMPYFWVKGHLKPWILKPGSIFKILNSLLEMFYYDLKVIKNLECVLQYYGNM